MGRVCTIGLISGSGGNFVSELQFLTSFIILPTSFTLAGSSEQKLDGKWLDVGVMFH